MEIFNDQQIYCSLDIETSGFDPLKDEVLEVGMVLFKIEDLRLKIVEEWTRVFKPSGEVSPKIFALTGIKQAELDAAEKFSDFREEIQAKLEGAVIVGHNVVFDVKFLESLGIKFSGKVIDTLDLVQWLLPTHHSYNLENLMHFFKVEHKDAHRALADAKAALEVLKKLLSLYSTFGQDLKQKIITIAKQQKFIWADILPLGIAQPQQPKTEPKNKLKEQPKLARGEVLEFKNHTAYNFPMGEDYLKSVVDSLLAGRKTNWLVLPKQQQVVLLWKQGLVEPVFKPEELFDETKFEAFLKKDLTADEAKFALKILVWQFNNWQNRVLFDLNLSFFGGQFKAEISGKKQQIPEKFKLLCSDFASFIEASPISKTKVSRLVIAGPEEFETAISSNLSQKVSWGSIIYLLKSIYNPELKTGNLSVAQEVVEALNATDLFFGLAFGLINKEGVKFADVVINQDFMDTDIYAKIKAAAENYANKILKLNQILKLNNLQEKIENLNSFFVPQPGRVKWLELAPNRLVFNNSPLEIGSVVKQQIDGFKEVVLVGSTGSVEILSFFLNRLGLADFKAINYKVAKKLKDLFTRQEKIRLHISPINFNSEEILKVIKPDSLPAAVLFGSQLQVKEFFEPNYSHLQPFAFLLNQSLSGGSNKLLRNFVIHHNSLLVATDKFVLKSLNGNSGNHLIEHLGVKTLIITRLPFEQFTHPYAQAVAAGFEKPFEQYSLPRAVNNLHKIIGFFYTPKLEQIYIWDFKLTKEYAKVFVDYLSANANWDIIK